MVRIGDNTLRIGDKVSQIGDNALQIGDKPIRNGDKPFKPVVKLKNPRNASNQTVNLTKAFCATCKDIYFDVSAKTNSR